MGVADEGQAHRPGKRSPRLTNAGPHCGPKGVMECVVRWSASAGGPSVRLGGMGTSTMIGDPDSPADVTSPPDDPWWKPTPALRRPAWMRSLRIVLGTILSLLLLWLAIREVPMHLVLANLAAIRYRFVGMALALVLASPLLRAIRWKLLFSPDQGGLRLPTMAVILLISQMLNIVLPARGGEAARIYLMSRTTGRRPAYTLGTIILEKWLDMVVLLALVAVVPMLLTPPSWFTHSSVALAVFAAVFFGVALVLSYGRERLLQLVAPLARFLPARWRRPVRDILETDLQSLDVLRSPRVGLQLQAWSLLMWIMSIIVNYLVLLALDVSAPFSSALFVLVVLQVGVAVPSVPGRLGVFQYLCILALSVFGVDRATALTYSFVLYFVVFLPPTLLGGLGLWWYVVSPGRKKDELASNLHRHPSP